MQSLPNDMPEPGYVLEIYLMQPKPGLYYKGLVIFWERTLAAESVVFSCPQCNAFLPDDYAPSSLMSSTGAPLVSCPSCKVVYPDGDLRSHLSFNMSLTRLAQELCPWVERLGRNVSIKLRRFKSEMTFRKAIGYANERNYDQKLRHARSGKAQEWVEYPKSRLQADLSLGKDLAQTIEAFLKA